MTIVENLYYFKKNKLFRLNLRPEILLIFKNNSFKRMIKPIYITKLNCNCSNKKNIVIKNLNGSGQE